MKRWINRTLHAEVDFDDEIFRAVFRKAAHEYLENEFLSGLPGQGEPEKSAVSEAFDERIRRMLRRAIRKERFRGILPKAAAGILIAVVVSSLLIMNVEAIRLSVFNYFIQLNDRISAVDIVENSPSPSPDRKETIQYEYIPSGYELVSTEEKVGKVTFTYQDKTGRALHITQYEIGYELNFDTENAEYESIVVNDQEAFYSIKEDYVNLIYKYEDRFIVIMGDIDLSESMKIAENIS